MLTIVIVVMVPRMPRIHRMVTVLDIPLPHADIALVLPILVPPSRSFPPARLLALAAVVVPALGRLQGAARCMAVAAVRLLPFLALAIGHALGPEVVRAGDDADEGCDVYEVAHDKRGGGLFLFKRENREIEKGRVIPVTISLHISRMRRLSSHLYVFGAHIAEWLF